MSAPLKIDLSGKTTLVTGGGGILCGHMAGVLAQAGAAVAVADLRKDAAEKVAQQIAQKGGKAIGVACNVLEKESIAAANQLVEKELGPVDILVNGAGASG